MAMKFRDKPEWKLGDTIQRDWKNVMLACGSSVLPTYGMENYEAEAGQTKAPAMLTPGGCLILPDLLLFRGPRGVQWHEVKAKGHPSWKQFPGRYEHGMDRHLADEYMEVQETTGIPVLIVVREMKVPVDPEQKSQLIVPGNPSWLMITLDKAFDIGEARPDWPGGAFSPFRRGRKSRGGLLWPRSAMQLFCENQSVAS